MRKFIRYALATFCFAASVGCLALWWRSKTYSDALWAPLGMLQRHMVIAESSDGLVEVVRVETFGRIFWQFQSLEMEIDDSSATPHPRRTDWFGSRTHGFYFPLWYASLIFALAGIGILRFRSQFSIRSALVCLTVVAALLGMAVGL